jgi:hypothetical protein
MLEKLRLLAKETRALGIELSSDAVLPSLQTRLCLVCLCDDSMSYMSIFCP